MIYKPSQAYYSEFTTSNPTTGAAQNADSLPVATANRNGADDGTFTLTVTNIDTGRYKITGAVPGGYVKGDVVTVTVAATVATVAGKGVTDSFMVDTLLVGDLNNAPDVSGNVSAIKTQTDKLRFNALNDVWDATHEGVK